MRLLASTYLSLTLLIIAASAAVVEEGSTCIVTTAQVVTYGDQSRLRLSCPCSRNSLVPLQPRTHHIRRLMNTTDLSNVTIYIRGTLISRQLILLDLSLDGKDMTILGCFSSPSPDTPQTRLQIQREVVVRSLTAKAKPGSTKTKRCELARGD
ncbi:hypothetical protein NEUTE1DRAFT_135145 [Neurospora tetrasperma FGSC 2508]|uniref:Uncharacterized protein n=1 Tax=Neurospora tetrasperma (strain FGSC 2508 / ATCC MYA-4615 / P0657) TaxID=510951 RepID=F8MBW0_NEUT8|nr:uncharacterized protein NEUTE1DRAFT_135145 [Neurospora tetrasperma FGSC 2508]EGO61169.1 hypothetical protein NEUTE1DRAFT_135145 [Neurospora tetrasperma FGSC 2508]EGZ74826.1 hypothetical protein NEUTE2DRAFT_163772 [Neurospora tetrasperma FGSC 2509]